MTVAHSAGRSRLPRRRRTVDVRGDNGTSLIELVVGMTVLSIFLSMFTGAVIMMNQATNKAQAVSLSSLQVNQAFINLDRTIRYAAAISTPGCGTGVTAPTCNGSTPGDYYIEFLNTNTVSPRCTQLRIDSNQLQSRSWDPSSLPSPPTTSQFTPLASGITNGTATDPFVLSQSTLYQQLTLTVESQSGGASTQGTKSSASFTFTALNSSVPSTPSPNCLQAGRS